MAERQPDLFGEAAPAAPATDPQVAAIIRARLHAMLDRVRGASAMPWPDRLAAIHAENGFRHDKDFLPPAEAAALWAEFDAELDRLYALAEAAEGPG